MKTFYDDVLDFHEKFALPHPADGPPRALPPEELRFRTAFLLEELAEYAEATGQGGLVAGLRALRRIAELDPQPSRAEQDLPAAFDALVDLAYVALGTAGFHRFPFNAGWAEVQRANLAKVRAESPDQSKRQSRWDVVKPPGWVPPRMAELLEEAQLAWDNLR